MKLLIVEDDAALTEALVAACAEAGIRPEICSTGEAAAELLGLYAYDAAVIDRGLPDMDGLDLVRRLREGGSSLPVVVLTAQSDAWSRVEGLNTGADDYLGKPFLFAELRARLNAVMRRADGRPANTLSCGNLAYDLDSQCVSIGGAPADLSPRDRSIIAALLRASGRPLSAARLEDLLCNPANALTSNALEVSIHRLRRKLAAAGCDARIEWQRGLGYCIKSAAA